MINEESTFSQIWRHGLSQKSEKYNDNNNTNGNNNNNVIIIIYNNNNENKQILP